MKNRKFFPNPYNYSSIFSNNHDCKPANGELHKGTERDLKIFKKEKKKSKQVHTKEKYFKNPLSCSSELVGKQQGKMDIKPSSAAAEEMIIYIYLNLTSYEI